eukprot:PhM_4_TR3009/c1_g2_i14/m.37816
MPSYSLKWIIITVAAVLFCFVLFSGLKGDNDDRNAKSPRTGPELVRPHFPSTTVASTPAPPPPADPTEHVTVPVAPEPTPAKTTVKHAATSSDITAEFKDYVKLLKPAPLVAVQPEQVVHAAPADLPRARPPPLSVNESAARGYLGDPKARQVPPPKCKYVFERYEPSPWEAKWAKNIGYYEKNVCASLNGEFKPLVDIYVEHFPKCTINSLATDGKPLPSECPEPTAPVPFDERVFSKYHYRLQCESDEALRASGLPERQVSYIEPLAGMLRRPTVCQDQAYENIINKNYMVIDEWTMKRNKKLLNEAGHRPRNFYFDAGASVWDNGHGGASQSWIVYQFESMCMNIDGGMYMWEAGEVSPKEALRKIPGRLKPWYHWFNEPVSPSRGSWDNPLNHILALTTPDDYVVFKIDIDASVVELPIMHTIIETPALLERIDEIYFEHHVTVEIMKELWRSAVSPRGQSYSMELFGKLRAAGVRAHSWV